MTEKRKPTYDLEAIRTAFSTPGSLTMTTSALRSATALGFGRQEIVETIRSIRSSHFYKSMTSNDDRHIWQDVYHVPTRAGVLYVKFTVGALTEFVLLSFKEKYDA